MAFRTSKRKLLMLVFCVILCGNILAKWYIEYRSNTKPVTISQSSLYRHYISKERREEIFSDKIVNISQNLKDKGLSVKSGYTVKIVENMNKIYTKIFNKSSADKSLGSKNVDIRNDYYPFVDFKFVLPEVSPQVSKTKKYFMIVLVNSGAKGEPFRKRRQAIRQTWGNRSNCEQRSALGDDRIKELRWLLVFVVGKTGTQDDHLNVAEAKQYNDMLIGNITDNYINNVVKLFMAQIWASRFNISYTMKTDDDVYVRIPRVLEYLVKVKFPRPFYGGKTYPSIRVNREITGKWTVSWKYYEETHFPRFNPGAFFILSSDLVDKLFKYVYTRKPFHTDDAYIGVAMRDFKVNTTRIYSFLVGPKMPKFIRTVKDCKMLGYSAFGDSVDPQSAKELHRRLQSHLCNNITFIKC